MHGHDIRSVQKITDCILMGFHNYDYWLTVLQRIHSTLCPTQKALTNTSACMQSVYEGLYTDGTERGQTSFAWQADQTIRCPTNTPCLHWQVKQLVET